MEILPRRPPAWRLARPLPRWPSPRQSRASVESSLSVYLFITVVSDPLGVLRERWHGWAGYNAPRQGTGMMEGQ